MGHNHDHGDRDELDWAEGGIPSAQEGKNVTIW